MPTDVEEPGQVVRDYLRALRDPGVLVDHAAAAQLGWLDDRDGDVIERLKARQQLLDLQDPARRMHDLEQEFVRCAKAWADDHGVSEDAFRAEGVKPAVLQAAGWGGRRRSQRAPAAGSQRAPAARTDRQRPRVTATDVWIAIPDDQPFTLRWLVEQTGASVATVRKVVTDEIAQGHIAEVGADPAHTGRGRAPTLYRWIATDV